MQWIHLRFVAPMASFGGETIDSHGVIRTMPAQSMITGLLANALGWTRSMRSQHQRLQDRIVFAAAWDSVVQDVSRHFVDYQTAKIGGRDRAWTTSGRVAGRDGGAGTYEGAHQRWQHYHADLRMTIVLGLTSPRESPTLDELAVALQTPQRPLFIGRKCCLPTELIYRGRLNLPTVLGALKSVIPQNENNLLAYWPGDLDKGEANRILTITDQRDWFSRLHGGARQVCEGRVNPSAAGE